MSDSSLPVSRGDIHKSEGKLSVFCKRLPPNPYKKVPKARCVASHAERKIAMAVVYDCYLKSVCEVVTGSVGGVFRVHKMALCEPCRSISVIHSRPPLSCPSLSCSRRPDRDTKRAGCRAGKCPTT